MTLSPSKCVFSDSTVDFAGLCVSADGIRVPKKFHTTLRQFRENPIDSIESARKFVGITSYLRHFTSKIGTSPTNYRIISCQKGR